MSPKRSTRTSGSTSRSRASASSRSRTSSPRSYKRRAPQARRCPIRLRHPSLIVMGLGALGIVWQMAARGSGEKAYISPDAVGLAGLILLLAGACGYWMECVGMRSGRR